MKKNPNFYYFGKCKYCNKEKALKNGICSDCEKKMKLPKGFNDIFGKFRGRDIIDCDCE